MTLTLRIPLLLLAAAILLTPGPSIAQPLDFLAPTTCAETPFSPELPLFSLADSGSLAKGLITYQRCGACSGACRGARANFDQCGVAPDGRIMHCSDRSRLCPEDGLIECICHVYAQ